MLLVVLPLYSLCTYLWRTVCWRFRPHSDLGLAMAGFRKWQDGKDWLEVFRWSLVLRDTPAPTPRLSAQRPKSTSSSPPLDALRIVNAARHSLVSLTTQRLPLKERKDDIRRGAVQQLPQLIYISDLSSTATPPSLYRPRRRPSRSTPPPSLPSLLRRRRRRRRLRRRPLPSLVPAVYPLLVHRGHWRRPRHDPAPQTTAPPLHRANALLSLPLNAALGSTPLLTTGLCDSTESCPFKNFVRPSTSTLGLREAVEEKGEMVLWGRTTLGFIGCPRTPADRRRAAIPNHLPRPSTPFKRVKRDTKTDSAIAYSRSRCLRRRRRRGRVEEFEDDHDAGTAPVVPSSTRNLFLPKLHHPPTIYTPLDHDTKLSVGKVKQLNKCDVEFAETRAVLGVWHGLEVRNAGILSCTTSTRLRRQFRST
ncbi:hypothetical protein MKEN_01017000 [Mycena kentingensis (nom. inval.)]|nr:hypothetical protein MKEN_01017000 [Mycena kentingensis (nom. inval.)]